MNSSSKPTDERATPQELFDALAKEHGPFDMDVCATRANAKCSAFYSMEADGLKWPWLGTIWCNPPYSRGNTVKWIKKAIEERKAGRAKKVVMLLPAATSNAWWHDYIPYCASFKFIRGRVKFGGAKTGAKFASVGVVL